ncbi:MAG: serine/threonine protein kinase, partial [Planctomycetota bacterium]|nr:serine/threonine protein kinase [Planctomycetota bacterium]
MAELLAVEIELREGSGDQPSLRQYEHRFPDWPQIVRQAFARSGKSPGEATFSGANISAQVGVYRLREVIGSGASSTVWKAIDTRLDRVVAVKIPHAGEFAADELTRLNREARLAARLRHPGIVRIYDVGVFDKRPFLVSELIDGKSLKDRLRERRFEPDEAAELCIQICKAAEHAHAHGLVHRDLKPANILLDLEGKPHIADFGLARATDGEAASITHEGQILGTPAYMAPEQASGKGVDARSDVYALGVLLYELLVGSRPFRGDATAVIHAVLHEDPAPPRRMNPSIPRDLETIALVAMA